MRKKELEEFNKLKWRLDEANKAYLVVDGKMKMYRDQVVKLTNDSKEKGGGPIMTDIESGIGYRSYKIDISASLSRKQQLENELAEINFAEKYPLSAHIKDLGIVFVEFFVHGKSIGKFTKEGAVEYARKQLKQTNWTQIGTLGTMDAYYEVRKIRKEREEK